MHTVLILGGYGFFGQRISSVLAQDPNIRTLVAGRDLEKARACAAQIGLAPEHALRMDAQSPKLATELAASGANTVVHTAGPFQGQGYEVARAAIEAGCHYIDLADGREFVTEIGVLDAAARAHGVLVASGASSLPALSSAVVDRYRDRFSSIHSIQIGIASGARSPGLATMRGVFGYCGKPIQQWHEGAWRTVHGWLGLYRYRFPAPVGARFLGNCDVPDLELFRRRYPGVRSVSFDAGFASSLGHIVVWLAAQAVRLRLLRSLVPLAAPLNTISRWMEPLTSDKGGMFVVLQGLDVAGHAATLRWHLIAEDNHGPFIPCGASIALVRKLARGHALPTGAMPCMGLLDVSEYLSALDGYSVRELEP